MEEKQILINKFLKNCKSLNNYLDLNETRYIHFGNKIQLNGFKLSSKIRKNTWFSCELTKEEIDNLIIEVKKVQDIHIPLNLKMLEERENKRKKLGITDEILIHFSNGYNLEVKSKKGDWYLYIPWNSSTYTICKKMCKWIEDGELQISELRFTQTFDYLQLIQ